MNPPAETSVVLYFNDRLKAKLALIDQYPLTIVEAPMGYGKTVAVREHLKAVGKHPVWVTALETGPEAFWRDFCAALARSFPNSAETLASLRSLGYPYDLTKAHAAGELMRGLDFSARTPLVIDDFHLLPVLGRPGSSGLAELLAGSETGPIKVILISRDDYPGGKELLSLKGILQMIDRSDLALTAAEITEYYRLGGQNLTREEAWSLRETTGGWISALYLHLLAFRKSGVLAPPLVLGALVEKEYLATLPPEALELLIVLYPLERFTGPQAEFMARAMGLGGAGDIVSELKRKNSFLNHDEADSSYAFHSIVRQVLGERFGRLPEERRRTIHRHQADWFVETGQTSAAIEFYHAACDHERALTILEADLRRPMIMEKAGFFVDFFKKCPPEHLENHLPTVFKFALAAFSSGDLASFAFQMDWLSRRCAALPENDPETDGWRGELELLRSMAAYNDIAAMSRHHRRANALLGRPTRLYGPESSSWTLGSPSVFFMFHRQSGALAEEIRLMHECLPHYYTLTRGHGSGGEYLMEAEAAYMTGDFGTAAVTVHRAEAMAASKEQISNIICCRFLRLRLHLMDGDYHKAEALIGDMRRLIREKRDFFLLHTIDLCQGYLRSTLGRLDDIPVWLGRGQGEERRLYNFAGGYYYLIHGRILLLDERPAELIGLFGWLLESGALAKNLLFTIQALIYTAAARHQLGQTPEALEALNRALTLAGPDRLYLPFVENWDHLGPLAKSGALADQAGSLARITALGTVWEKRRRGCLARHDPQGYSPLSPREEEMARLAVAGRKYREIAETLFLAPTTVKKAFVNIYKKLGITSRRELADYFNKR